MTDAERLLWSRVRGKQIGPVPFYRQKPLGGYIVDFHFATNTQSETGDRGGWLSAPGAGESCKGSEKGCGPGELGFDGAKELSPWPVGCES
jgi:hypothetical protein